MKARVLFASLIIAGSVVACGGSGGTDMTLKDALGRTCVESGELSMECDAAPIPSTGCAASATASFMVGSLEETKGPAAICAGCCTGYSGSMIAADCVAIECATDDECPRAYGACVNSRCVYQ